MKKVSPEGRDLIAAFEQGPHGGPALKAYLCPAGQWTIGYGHTKGVRPGDTLASKVVADMLLDEDLVTWAAEVEKVLDGTPTSQHEFDAMVSLAFNIGMAGFNQSTVLRLHKAGDRTGAARAFALWNKAKVDGRLIELTGLTRRRAAEAAHYLAPDQAWAVEPMPQAVQPEATAARSRTVIAGGVAVASSAAAMIDQVSQIVGSLSQLGGSIQGLLKLGAVGLSVVALLAAAYMLWRYLGKKRRAEVIST